MNRLISVLKENLPLFISVSLGIFLFILFFQPFPLARFDFENSLLFVAGFGAIVFLSMVLFRVVYPWVLHGNSQLELKTDFPSYLADFIIVVLTSLAFAFYLRYVGQVSLTFYIVFKLFIICLTIPFVLRIYDTLYGLDKLNNMLIAEKRALQEKVEGCEEDGLSQLIEFSAENNSGNFKLLIRDLVLLRSADNYVEIIYKEDDHFKKKLIRNTLKNIELQIKQYTFFLRCHRTSIVNKKYIGKLVKKFNNYSIFIDDFPEQIPVSRQYLLKLKESL